MNGVYGDAYSGHTSFRMGASIAQTSQRSGFPLSAAKPWAYRSGMNDHLYPLLMTPVYKDYIWGGRRIPERYERDVDLDVCAESWEVADRPEGMSVVANGPLKGTTLGELVASMGHALTGTTTPPGPFPLLIKLIDARQTLSVQVHPNDTNAAACGGEAKTEMWYVLDAAPGAEIFAGLRQGVDEERLLTAIEGQGLETILTTIPAAPGEAVFIPGGTLHAIGAGCLLLEIQQNSNTTYRVYDWGRVGHDGKARELHVAKALQVIDWDRPPPQPIAPRQARELATGPLQNVVRSPLFHVDRLLVASPGRIEQGGESFSALFLESGRLDVSGGGHEATLNAGASCLLPAALPSFELLPREPSAAIRIRLGIGGAGTA
jgi:mannose-6-phosphate isomerase